MKNSLRLGRIEGIALALRLMGSDMAEVATRAALTLERKEVAILLALTMPNSRKETVKMDCTVASYRRPQK